MGTMLSKGESVQYLKNTRCYLHLQHPNTYYSEQNFAGFVTNYHIWKDRFLCKSVEYWIVALYLITIEGEVS